MRRWWYWCRDCCGLSHLEHTRSHPAAGVGVAGDAVVDVVVAVFDEVVVVCSSFYRRYSHCCIDQIGCYCCCSSMHQMMMMVMRSLSCHGGKDFP